LLVVALLLTGCTTQSVPFQPAAAGAVVGGMLRIGITTPGSLDPGNDYEPMGDLVLRSMCDPLIAADPVTGELKPGLVQSWVVSDSGQRLVVRLRKGLRFSDGSSLTSDDVVSSLNRLASAEFASAVASKLEDVEGYPFVHGDAETDKDEDRRSLYGVRALDQQSVEITLALRKGDFLRLLTSRLLSPVPRGSPDSLGRQPICSGPYALEKPYAAGDPVIRLARVPGYKPADSTLSRRGEGYPDRLEFHVFATAARAAVAQRQGRVDVAAAEASDTAGVQSGPGALVDYVGFPTALAPVFDKPPVRRALALALDRVALAAAVFPRTRVAATGFLPPTTLPVFTPAGCSSLPVRGDAAEARRLVGQQLAGLRVPFYVNEDGRNVALARAVAAQWKRVLGLDLVVRPMEFDSFLAKGTSQKGFDGPFRFSWATSYADPDGALYPLFSSERIGRDNASRYSNPDFDRTVGRQAREATDAGDRQLEYRAAEQILCQDVPMVPLTFSVSRYLVSARVATATTTFVDRTSGQLLVRELYLRSPR